MAETEVALSRDELRARIQEERQRKGLAGAGASWKLAAAGNPAGASRQMLFHLSPGSLETELSEAVASAGSVFRGVAPGGAGATGSSALAFLLGLGTDLRSFLTRWSLEKGEDENTIRMAADKVLAALGSCAAAEPELESHLLSELRRAEAGRLIAEGLEDRAAIEEAASLVGDSLVDYALRIIAGIEGSAIKRVCSARFGGATTTEIGNDYAAFLDPVIRLGGSFETTNPVLIKLAWDADRDLWDHRMDALIRQELPAREIAELALLAGESAGGDSLDRALRSLASLVTLSVVEENCRKLRDIFLVTEGREGYVSLQVNPKNHDDPTGMVQEARGLYQDLTVRLGGVPNVVFKLPATKSGLAAAEELTAAGIGVTITVSFSVFQARDFAAVLDRGNALVSYIALMNGRLAYPVRDELARAIGATARGAVGPAELAGVEVARKASRTLYGGPPQAGAHSSACLGVDPGRVKLLIASLRIYDDRMPDVTDMWGVPLITIFPNVRRAYEELNPGFDGGSIWKETSHNVMEGLFQSEIFRQAWWIPGDAADRRPQRAISLAADDQQALLKWQPVQETLDQFVDLYDQMCGMIRYRLARMKG